MAINKIATLGVKVDPRGAIAGSSKAKRAITGIGNSAKRVKSQIFSLNGALGALGAGAVLKSIIKSAAGLESLRVRLKFLTGSVDNAGIAFKTMTEFASKVPFALEDIQAASPLLLTVVDDVEELNGLLEMAGDIAAVSGLTFVQTAEQLQRSMAGGIAAADLFRERGVAAFLGFQQGVSYSADETKKILNALWDDGTTTAKGATSELAKTFIGQVSMMEDAWFKLKITMADAGLFELAKDAVMKLTEMINDPKTQENAAKFGEVLTTIGRAVGNVAKTLMGLPPWVLEVGVIMAFLGGKKARLVIAGITALALGIDAVTQAIANFKAEGGMSSELSDAQDEVDRLATRYNILKDSIEDAKAILQPFYDQMLQHQRGQGGMAFDDFLPSEQKLIMDTRESLKALDRQMVHIRAAYDLARDALEKEKNLLFANISPTLGQWVAGLEITITKGYVKTEEAADSLAKTYDFLSHNAERVTQTFHRQIHATEIMGEKFDEMARIALEAETKMKEFSEGLADSIEDSIMRMTQGLMSFKDVVKSIFQYVAAQMVKMHIASPLANALSASISNAMSGMITGTPGVGVGGHPARAGGGSVSANQPYTVGERGTELFVPSSSGSIVPNNQLGGQTINVTYSPQVNALDPRTAQSVIFENAPTIVGVVRQAFERNGQQVAI